MMNLTLRISEQDKTIAYLLNTIQHNTIQSINTNNFPLYNDSNLSSSSSPTTTSNTATTHDYASSVSVLAEQEHELTHDKKRKIKTADLAINSDTNMFIQHDDFLPVQPSPLTTFQQPSSTTTMPPYKDYFNQNTMHPNPYPEFNTTNYRSSNTTANTAYSYEEGDELQSDDDFFDFEALLDFTSNDHDDMLATTATATTPSAGTTEDVMSHLSQTESNNDNNNSHTTKLSDSDKTTDLLNKVSAPKLDAQSLSELMRVLSPQLQERFIDQLAQSMGQSFNANVHKIPDTSDFPHMNPQVVQAVSDEIGWQEQHMLPCMNATATSTERAVGGDTTNTAMGPSKLETECPLVALGALLASVRLTSSQLTESATKNFVTSCSNLKSRLSRSFMSQSNINTTRQITSNTQSSSRISYPPAAIALTSQQQQVQL